MQNSAKTVRNEPKAIRKRLENSRKRLENNRNRPENRGKPSENDSKMPNAQNILDVHLVRCLSRATIVLEYVGKTKFVRGPGGGNPPATLVPKWDLRGAVPSSQINNLS